uniref:Uncharacterized protein n=1 Tax=Rangifer tarandus platyrhynchus TaxID=3082113 RepID=A0ACB0FGC7_RANTA|nr:unnamed protein product [Rangifer tarandus platyrhynchus]
MANNVTPATLTARLTGSGPEPEEGKTRARGRERAGAGDAKGRGRRARARCARRRRRRVTSVRHVPVFTSLVEPLRQQPNGNTVAILRLCAPETRPFVRPAPGCREQEEEGRGDPPGRAPEARKPRAPTTRPPGPAPPAPHLRSAADSARRPRSGGGPGGRGACKQTRPHVTM